MARTKSVILSKEEKKAAIAETKAAIKAAKVEVKDATTARKTLDKEYNAAVKEAIQGLLPRVG